MSTVLGSGSFSSLQVTGSVYIGLQGGDETQISQVLMGRQGHINTHDTQGTFSNACFLYCTGNEYVEVSHNRRQGGNEALVGGNSFVEGTINGLLPTPPYYSSVIPAFVQARAEMATASGPFSPMVGAIFPLGSSERTIVAVPDTAAFPVPGPDWNPSTTWPYTNPAVLPPVGNGGASFQCQDFFFTTHPSIQTHPLADFGLALKPAQNPQAAGQLLQAAGFNFTNSPGFGNGGLWGTSLWTDNPPAGTPQNDPIVISTPSPISEAMTMNALALLTRPMMWTAESPTIGTGPGAGGIPYPKFPCLQIILPDASGPELPAWNLQTAIEILLGPVKDGMHPWEKYDPFNPSSIEMRESPGGLCFGDYVSVDFTIQLKTLLGMDPGTLGSWPDGTVGRIGVSNNEILNMQNYSLCDSRGFVLVPMRLPGELNYTVIDTNVPYTQRLSKARASSGWGGSCVQRQPCLDGTGGNIIPSRPIGVTAPQWQCIPFFINPFTTTEQVGPTPPLVELHNPVAWSVIAPKTTPEVAANASNIGIGQPQQPPAPPYLDLPVALSLITFRLTVRVGDMSVPTISEGGPQYSIVMLSESHTIDANGPLRPSIIEDGLVLWVDAGDPESYDSGSPTEWHDMCPNHYNLTLGGTGGASPPTFNAANGGYLEFSGQQFAANIDAGILTTSGTVEIWYVPNNNVNRMAWSCRGSPVDATTFPDLSYGLNNNPNHSVWSNQESAAQFSLDGGGAVINDWNYVAIVRQGDNNSSRCYVNGVERSQTIYAGGTTEMLALTPQTGFCVGARLHDTDTFDYLLDGAVAIVRVYDKALTEEQIQNNFDLERGRFGL